MSHQQVKIETPPLPSKLQDSPVADPSQDTASNQNTRRKTSASIQRSKSKQPAAAAAILLPIVLATIWVALKVDDVNCVLVHQVRFIATKSGRIDYALTDETIEFSCHYLMKDEAEDVKQLVWSKDGKNFLRWRKNRAGLEVLNYIFKGHIDETSKHTHIIIHNVTIDMHGKYKCSVKTDLGTHEMEQDLVVISQPACKLSDWRLVSDPGQCRETFHLDCRNMFPKPVPSCGLWNSKLDKFIRAVVVDISEDTARKQTYRVKYSDRFDLIRPAAHDLLAYAGHLLFKCDISVPETSWKLSLVHKMFDYSDACLQDPLEALAKLRANYSRYAAQKMQQAGYLLDARQLDDFELLANSNLKYELLAADRRSSAELNCWRKPKLGSLARLSCVPKFGSNPLAGPRLSGASLLQCGPFGWFPVKSSQVRPAPSSGSSSSSHQQPAQKGRPPRPSRPSALRSRPPDPAEDGKIPPHQGNGTREPPPPPPPPHIQAIDSNDLDEPQLSTTTTTTTADIIPALSEAAAAAPGDSSAEAAAAAAAADGGHITQAAPEEDPLLSMTPSELVSLLPTCVSPRPRQQRPPPSSGGGGGGSSDRLPLRDGGGGLMIMESAASPTRGKPAPSIFSFSSSGCNQSAISPPQHCSCSLLACLLASTLLILLTSRHRMSNNPLEALFAHPSEGGGRRQQQLILALY